MVKTENHCCDCATPGYPCQSPSCPHRNVRVAYCDLCGEEIDGDVYSNDLYTELCEDCLKELYKKTN